MIRITKGKHTNRYIHINNNPIAVNEGIKVINKVDWLNALSTFAVINCPIFFAYGAGAGWKLTMIIHFISFTAIFFYVKFSVAGLNKKLEYIKTLSKGQLTKNKYED